MGRENDLMILVNSLKCLIVFEKKACSLYEDVADRIDSHLVKSLMLHISLDGKKHSTVLKGVALSMPKKSWKPAELPKTMNEAWRSIDAFQVELSNVDAIPESELSNLCAQLTELENSFAVEYNSLLQLSTLELLSEELNSSYKISLETLKTILFEILHDEEYHKEILGMVVGLVEDKEEEKIDNTPTVRFRNPDAWSRPMPMTT
jgi:hypothetical protein